MMKKAGYDAIFVKGLSEKPLYVVVENGHVEFRDAAHMWGMSIKQTESVLKEEIPGSKFEAAMIGPGGEGLSYMAAVMTDTDRAAGRGGSGAVMGSKLLKAIVVLGDQKSEVFDREKLVELNKHLAQLIKNNPFAQGFKQYGTGGMLFAKCLNVPDAGVKNWSGSSVGDYPIEKVKDLSDPYNYDDQYYKKKYACSACPVGCGASYDVKDGEWPLEDAQRPEYESIAGFGSNLLNYDHKCTIKCNDICNEYGLDVISVSGTVAWAMECYEKGILTKDELDGIELTWGNAQSIVAITEKICKGEGCGEILKNGSEFAAKAYGKGEECLAVAGGIEIGQHDPRLSPGLARTYKYDPTPGRHMKGGYGLFNPIEPPYKGTGFKDMLGMTASELLNSSGICFFYRYAGDLTVVPKYINAVTGFDLTRQDEINIGIRSFTIRTAFNLREGIRREDHTLSKKLYKAPEEMTGPNKGVHVDVELLADNLFNALGWNMDMVPQRESLELVGGLENVVADFYPLAVPV
jgi:aldehyde:ferredoxin oxidoreductase